MKRSKRIDDFFDPPKDKVTTRQVMTTGETKVVKDYDGRIMDLTPERYKKTESLLQVPNMIDIICSAVANGGSLVELTIDWDVRYSDIYNWVQEDDERKEKYNMALKGRDEWFIAALLRELQLLATSDITKLFDKKGELLPMDEWPPGAARCVEAVKVDEVFEGSGKDREHVGYTKQIKLWNKPKAIEMLGKHLKMFLDRYEVSGTLTLEDLVLDAGKKNNEDTST